MTWRKFWELGTGARRVLAIETVFELFISQQWWIGGLVHVGDVDGK